MVTAKVTVVILQHINVSNQQVVHLRLAQCYVPITVSQLSQRMRWGGGRFTAFSQCSEPSFKYQQPPLLTSAYRCVPGHHLISAGSF